MLFDCDGNPTTPPSRSTQRRRPRCALTGVLQDLVVLAHQVADLDSGGRSPRGALNAFAIAFPGRIVPSTTY